MHPFISGIKDFFYDFKMFYNVSIEHLKDKPLKEFSRAELTNYQQVSHMFDSVISFEYRHANVYSFGLIITHFSLLNFHYCLMTAK